MSLTTAHYCIAKIVGPENIEPLESAIVAEEIRNRWRPKIVRVLLLAESHVWTPRDELNSRVSFRGREQSNFVRLVYCLGYGEPSIVNPRIDSSGTPQFWRLFQDCLESPKSGRKKLRGEDRIACKLNLLERLREAGIWLVDASITGLYHNGWKISGKMYDAAINASWDSYVGSIVREASPTAVLVIGKTVRKVLGEKIEAAANYAKIEVISAPNARLEKGELMEERKRCYDFCSQFSFERTDPYIG